MGILCSDRETLTTESPQESFKGKSLLSKMEPTSGSGESAAVHFVQSGLASFSNVTGESDNDPAVVRTVEMLSVVGSDAPIQPRRRVEHRNLFRVEDCSTKYRRFRSN